MVERVHRPAFYALRKGGWRDYVTLLHPPYTAWHLSYVVIGAAAAPVFDLGRMGWTLLAFFLAVGLGAHSLDELHGRPLHTRIPSAVLWLVSSVSSLAAVAIGVYGTIIVSPTIGAFIAFGGFILWAYNLELCRGFFHSDLWFAFAWGAFPFLTAYWASALTFNAGAVALAGVCFGLSLAQRKLSARARSFRRRAVRVAGSVEYIGGKKVDVTAEWLLSMPELVLKVLAATAVLLAAGMLAMRL